MYSSTIVTKQTLDIMYLMNNHELELLAIWNIKNIQGKFFKNVL